jgi:hypothetical protein
MYENEDNWEDHLSDVLDKLEEITGAQVLHSLVML